MNNLEKFKTVSQSWDLYESSFPVNERRTIDMMVDICRDERFTPYVFTQGNETAALFYTWQYDENTTYLEHFAVRKDLRNQGLGGKLLDAFIKTNPRVILEAEDPDNAPPDAKLAKRRIEFYKRHGIVQTHYSYFNPGYLAGIPPYPLELLSNVPWTKEDIEKFLDFIFSTITKKTILRKCATLTKKA